MRMPFFSYEGEELMTTGDTVWGLLSARERSMPDRIFLRLVDSEEQLTYSEAKHVAECMARSLLDFGIVTGDKVGIMLSNSTFYASAWLACLAAGLVDVPINPEYRYTLLDHAIQRAGTVVVFTDANGISALRTASEESWQRVRLVIVPDSVYETLHEEERLSCGARLLSVSMLVENKRNKSVTLPQMTSLSLASMRFTSGSTGLPKLVMMNNGHLLASARKFLDLMQYGSGDVLYTCFPFHHVLASVTGMLSTICAGGTLIVAPKFSVHKYWEHIREYGATHAQILDPLIPLLLKQPETALDRQHNVTKMYTAAGSYEDFETRFGVTIVPLYDMTELTVPLCYAENEPRRPGSCGRESGLFDVKILDEFDEEQPASVDGEICVRPRFPNIMFLGYYGDAEQTVERWKNLWFHTGDRGKQDEDGYFYFLGRMGDRIRRRGVNVSAEEIEIVALQNTNIEECAVIAVPSDITEDDIKLCVVLRRDSDTSESDIAKFMDERLPKSYKPRYIEIYERLPKTDTEKIRRAALRTEGSHGLTSSTWDAQCGRFITPGEVIE